MHKEIPALESLLNTAAGLQPATLSKKRLRYRCFHKSFAKFLRQFLSTSPDDYFWKSTGFY